MPLEGASRQDCWKKTGEQTISSLAHIEEITLGAGEEVDEVARRAGGMGVHGIGEVGDWASEGQAGGVYGAGFTVGSQAGKGARGGTRGMGDKVSIDKKSWFNSSIYNIHVVL